MQNRDENCNTCKDKIISETTFQNKVTCRAREMTYLDIMNRTQTLAEHTGHTMNTAVMTKCKNGKKLQKVRYKDTRA